MSLEQQREPMANNAVYWNKKRKDAAGGAAFLSIVLIIIYALTARLIGLAGLIILLLFLALFWSAVFWGTTYSTEQKKRSRDQQDNTPLYARILEQKEQEEKLEQAPQLPAASVSPATPQKIPSPPMNMSSSQTAQDQVKQQSEQVRQEKTREQLLLSASLGFLPEPKQEERPVPITTSDPIIWEGLRQKTLQREKDYLSQLEEVAKDLQETDPEKIKQLQEKYLKKEEELLKKKEEAEKRLQQAKAQLELEAKQFKEKEAEPDEKIEKEVEMTIYCIHCGTQLPAIASYCLKCGKPVKGAITAAAQPASQVESCEIICQSGGVLGGKSYFVARALGPGGVYIAAVSTKKFRSVAGGSDSNGNDWYQPDTYSWGSKPLAEAAFDEIVTTLSGDGWQQTLTGPAWWQCKFKRQIP